MRHPDKKAIALADVARCAGVSISTASLALQEGSRISDETRRRVMQAVEEVGYRYNRNAAKLRTGQSKTVGLLITDIANPFFAALAAGVETELDQFGYMTFLVNSNDDRNRQFRQLSSLREHGVDGILLSPADGTIAEEVLAGAIPVVQVSRFVAENICDVVAPDNIVSAEAATRHLIGLGHRRIAFLGGTESRSARIERIAGYARALAEARIAIDAELMPMAAPNRANGAALLSKVMSLQSPPTAVLCYHDLMALGALDSASQLGLVVGRDLAVIGFDDITEAALCSPPLTTIHIDAAAIGRAAARRLLARMQGDKGPPQRITIPTHLVVRQSCGSKRVE